MEILFHRYGSICEPDIIDAFKSLGITVLEENSEIYEKAISADVRIKVLAEKILLHKPVFVFSINYFPYISEVCQRLNTLYVCLSVDCPVLEFFSDSIHNSCNRIFLFDYKQYTQFYNENPECIFYLPLGTNTNRWDEVLCDIKNTTKERFLYDVSMVGSLYTEKSPYGKLKLSEMDRGFVDGIMESQRRFMGMDLLEEAITDDLVASIKNADAKCDSKSWQSYVLPDVFCDTDRYVALNYYLGMHMSKEERVDTLNALAKDYKVELFTRSDARALKGVHVHGGVTTHKEMPLVFYRSKINLNMTIRPIQMGLSQRVWDVLGCEGFLLSNYQAEIPEYLEVGKDLDFYETIAELKQKVAYYLEHEDVRMEIAHHGYETVKAKHTCRHRVAEMLKIVLTMHL